MIEKMVRDYLLTKLDCEVVMEIPETPADRFVLIEKTGSGRGNRIDTATIALQSYAPSLYEAAQLNERVKEAMDAMPDTEDVYGVQLNSDYNFTDTARKRHRYQAVYNLTF